MNRVVQVFDGDELVFCPTGQREINVGRVYVEGTQIDVSSRAENVRATVRLKSMEGCRGQREQVYCLGRYSALDIEVGEEIGPSARSRIADLERALADAIHARTLAMGQVRKAEERLAKVKAAVE